MESDALTSTPEKPVKMHDHCAPRPHKRFKAEAKTLDDLLDALRQTSDIFEALVIVHEMVTWHCGPPEHLYDATRALEEYMESGSAWDPSILRPGRALNVATLVLSETDRITPLAFACVLGLPADVIRTIRQYRTQTGAARLLGCDAVVREDELWPGEASEAAIARMRDAGSLWSALDDMPRGTR